MQNKIEGLILSKIPYDERHLIATLLLRSGRKISVVFYGGRGGGVKQKSSIIELGFMLSVELRNSKTTTDIYHAKEWNLIWNHDLIRLDFRAFYLMCFFLEIINRVSSHDHLHEVIDNNDEMLGLFSLLSNALVFLEKKLMEKKFFLESHALIFLIKLLYHLGVFPERNYCSLCGERFIQNSQMELLAKEGGFCCENCIGGNKNSKGKLLWEIMGVVAQNKYSDLGQIAIGDKSLPRSLFQYFCFQFNLDEKNFKTASMVF